MSCPCSAVLQLESARNFTTAKFLHTCLLYCTKVRRRPEGGQICLTGNSCGTTDPPSSPHTFWGGSFEDSSLVFFNSNQRACMKISRVLSSCWLRAFQRMLKALSASLVIHSRLCGLKYPFGALSAAWASARRHQDWGTYLVLEKFSKIRVIQVLWWSLTLSRLCDVALW